MGMRPGGAGTVARTVWAKAFSRAVRVRVRVRAGVRVRVRVTFWAKAFSRAAFHAVSSS